MINNEYINILFAILTASLLGALFNIITQHFSIRKKIKLVILLVIITIILILLATLIFFYDEIDIKISLLDLKEFSKSKMLPFHNEEFNDSKFNTIYNINIFISLFIFIIEYRIAIQKNTPKKKFFIVLFTIFLLIISIMRIWTIYITCNILSIFPVLICCILQLIFYSFITFFELILLYYFCYQDPYAKLSEDELNDLRIQKNIEAQKIKKEIRDILDEE